MMTNHQCLNSRCKELLQCGTNLQSLSILQNNKALRNILTKCLLLLLLSTAPDLRHRTSLLLLEEFSSGKMKKRLKGDLQSSQPSNRYLSKFNHMGLLQWLQISLQGQNCILSMPKCYLLKLCLKQNSLTKTMHLQNK